jgi:putative glutamine amidotransferase
MSNKTGQHPRIGIPYRTRKEELTGDFAKLEKYILAVRATGAEAVVLSLGFSAQHIEKIASTLDGILLTGSPADVVPSRFGARRHPKCADPDPDRERTDFALLEHAFAEQKPVLAICYGIQSLNVFLGGTLVQDIPSEVSTEIEHDWPSEEEPLADVFHTARIEPGSRLEGAAQAAEVEVNSSHHQSIQNPGRGLRVVARAPDGVIEAVEWTGDSNWVTGVQWHPERIVQTHPLAQILFRDLVEAARQASVRTPDAASPRIS